MSNSMNVYIYTRVAQLLPVLLVVIVLNFVLIRMAPGDPTRYLIGEAPVSDEYVANLRTQLGLDKPVPQQLLIYLGQVTRGDLGYSYISRAPVTSIILARLPPTLLLMVSQMILAVIVGILLGVVSAIRPRGALDMGVTLLSVIGYGMPVFWLGQMLMLIFALKLGLLPAQGMLSLRYELGPIDYTIDLLRHLVLPTLTLALFNMALIARITRANMLQTLRLEFITFAHSKGLAKGIVIFRHALKNAVLPVVTIIGLNVRQLIAGAVLTETVFGWPGLGRLTYEAIFARDYPVLMGMFIFVGFTVVVANLLTDLVYAYLDPRIHYR